MILSRRDFVGGLWGLISIVALARGGDRKPPPPPKVEPMPDPASICGIDATASSMEGGVADFMEETYDLRERIYMDAVRKDVAQNIYHVDPEDSPFAFYRRMHHWQHDPLKHFGFSARELFRDAS